MIINKSMNININITIEYKNGNYVNTYKYRNSISKYVEPYIRYEVLSSGDLNIILTLRDKK